MTNMKYAFSYISSSSFSGGSWTIEYIWLGTVLGLMWWGRSIETISTFSFQNQIVSQCHFAKGRSCISRPTWNPDDSNHRWSWEHKNICGIHSGLDPAGPRWFPGMWMDAYPDLNNNTIRWEVPSPFKWISDSSLDWISLVAICLTIPSGETILFKWVSTSSLESAAFVDIIHTNGDLTPSAASLWVAAEHFDLFWMGGESRTLNNLLNGRGE